MSYKHPEHDPRFAELVRLYKAKKEMEAAYDKLNESLQVAYGPVALQANGMDVQIVKLERLTYSSAQVLKYLSSECFLDVVKVVAGKLPAFLSRVQMDECVETRAEVLVTQVREHSSAKKERAA